MGVIAPEIVAIVLVFAWRMLQRLVHGIRAPFRFRLQALSTAVSLSAMPFGILSTVR